MSEQHNHVPSRRELRARRQRELRAAEPSAVREGVQRDTEQSLHDKSLRAIEAKARREEAGGIPVREQGKQGPKRGRRTLATVLILVIIIALAFGGVFLVKKLLGGGSVSDYSGAGEGAVTVEVPPGSTGSSIGKLLAENDIVASREAFSSAFSSNPEARSIQPGTYKLSRHMSAAAALAGLMDSANRIDSGLSIPEGFTLKQITRRLVERGGYEESEVEAALKNPESFGLPDEAGGNPEGWIAPATYARKKGEPVTELLSAMIQKNVDRLEQLNVPRDRWQEVLTKGSILEREVADPKYLPQVARVIDNRLDPQLGKPVLNRLQMDSTVSYAVGRSSGIPTGTELQTDSPYNTYKNPGLPPSPIGVVGTNAIKAVMAPASGDWLYFVTTNLQTGETNFYDNYDQFLEGKAELQQYCKDNPGRC